MTYKEIVRIAEEINIEKETIDKDWVLGHFLNAMFSYNDIQQNFVFKGGTCLKKCYFGDYRFSEDLDFTLLDAGFVIDRLFIKKIIDLAEQNSGAKFYLKEIKSQIYKDIPQGYEVTIQFWGAYHKPNQRELPINRWQTKIKLDISFSETALLEPEKKNISHPYSDSKIIKSIVPAYPLNEVIAEKLRSLIQRNRARDIYDLYYLSGVISNDNYADILNLLKQKAKNKKIGCCKYDDFVSQKKYNRNKRAWKSSLVYHLPDGKLIDFDMAYETIKKFIKNIISKNQ